MKQITYKNQSYNIPTDWNEITLGMQINAEELIKDIGDELALIGLISSYTEIPASVIKEGDIKTINDIHETIAFIYDGYVPDVIESFTHGGHQYYLSELTNTQFQDFLSMQIIMQNNKKNPIKGLPRLIAVMCKRMGETLDDYDLDEREKLFLDLPLSTAKDIEGFFLSKAKALENLMALSTKDFQKDVLSMKLESLKSTIKESRMRHGFFSPINWLIGIYQLTLKYLGKRLVRYFSTQ